LRSSLSHKRRAVVMISFIKNLFSGILSFFIGLFKKSQENQLNATSSAEN